MALLRPLVNVKNNFLKFLIFQVLKKLLKNLTSLRVCSGLYAYAEHTHQELVRQLSIRARNWCTCWAYVSGTDAYAQHTHQFSIFITAVPSNHLISSPFSHKIIFYSEKPQGNLLFFRCGAMPKFVAQALAKSMLVFAKAQAPFFLVCQGDEIRVPGP